MLTGKKRVLVMGICLPLAALGQASGDGTDVFGIRKLMPSQSPALEWDSRHWSTGGKRTLTGYDPLDPTGWSRGRGDAQLMEVDGQGMLRMGGVQPRIYFMSAPGKPLFFRDVEFTAYFRRVGSDGATNGGIMVGGRSGAEGHASQPCSASTYYAGFRYPGTWIFDKEIFHPQDAPGKSGKLFPGGSMPAGRWIGLKYLLYNLPGNKAVQLELYADTVSDGVPVNGGTWTRVSEHRDEGNWVAPVGDCGFAPNTVVTQGGGVFFMRNTGAAEAHYKMLSIREIAPAAPTGLPQGDGLGLPASRPFRGAVWLGGGQGIRLAGMRKEGWVWVSDVQGKRLGGGLCSPAGSGAGHCEVKLARPPSGLALVSLEGETARILLPPRP